MKKISLVFVFGFLFSGFLGLEIKSQTLLQDGEIPKDLLISLERKFNCVDLSDLLSDKCRDYSLKIDADGNVVFTFEETSKKKSENVRTKVTKKKDQAIDR